MRVWDIHPGFLNRQSLLGEHREIHAIHTVLSQHKKGYSRHPETLRWQDHLPALWLRHEQVVAEMRLRGFNHFSPLPAPHTEIIWPSVFIDTPGRQFELLARKYATKEQGRIPLPANAGELLGSHALSLISRECLPASANPATPESFASLAEALVHHLRQPPTKKGRTEVLALLEVPNLRDASLLLDYVPQKSRQATVLNELLLWP
ncbi:MAG: hypothetical protein D9V46_10260 [Deltaproteobacteria bacterium]|uniref:pyrimidine dimer DNA glycosylase/endonuclease V n=1 Tax=Hydrosulfovibrio ferrireducens TaxID=2934181 RepID=UPI00121AB3EA|nr:MAG: hypothetical protein D9V46_10260 [Deltaproteobacteria bacterium]